MISKELKVEVRRLFYVDRLSIHGINQTLGLHRDTVVRALRDDAVVAKRKASKLDDYLDLIDRLLGQYPKMTGTRILGSLHAQGYVGSLRHLRRQLAILRPTYRKQVARRVVVLPGEQAQVDWGHFGIILVGAKKRNLSAFVMTLAWSRAIFVKFTFDQKIETLIAAHLSAFQYFGGACRSMLYDNMKTVVIERSGQLVRYHDDLLELAKMCHFKPTVCSPYHPQSKGRVERSIRYLRENFFQDREVSDIQSLNSEVIEWCRGTTMDRPWRDDPSKNVREALEEERLTFLPVLPTIQPVPRRHPACIDAYAYVSFDCNFYSAPWAMANRKVELEIYEDRIVLIDGLRKIAAHERCWSSRVYVTDESHFCDIPKGLGAKLLVNVVTEVSSKFPLFSEIAMRWIEENLDLMALTKIIAQNRKIYGEEICGLMISKMHESKLRSLDDARVIMREILMKRDRKLHSNLNLPNRNGVNELEIELQNLSTYDNL